MRQHPVEDTTCERWTEWHREREGVLGLERVGERESESEREREGGRRRETRRQIERVSKRK